MTTPLTGRLSELPDEELGRLLALVRSADSVELKLTVPMTEHRATITALQLDPLEAQIRQVFFFDTPDLTLNQAGIVARARRIQGRGGDSVVKLRPVVPDDLPAELRQSPGLNVEVDAMPGGYVCSAALKGRATNEAVTEAVAGRLPLRKLFTKEQRSFFKEHVPEGLDLDGLAVLGPVFVLKLKLAPEDYGRKVVAEVWLYPGGDRILELSTKCLPGEMLQVAAESRIFLNSRGVGLDGEQQTKTKTALEYFSQGLQATEAVEQ